MNDARNAKCDEERLKVYSRRLALSCAIPSIVGSDLRIPARSLAGFDALGREVKYLELRRRYEPTRQSINVHSVTVGSDLETADFAEGTGAKNVGVEFTNGNAQGCLR